MRRWQATRNDGLPHLRLDSHHQHVELVELEFGGGSAQLDVVNARGVALLGGLNRCRAVLLIDVLDLDRRGDTLVTVHVGENDIGSIHL